MVHGVKSGVRAVDRIEKRQAANKGVQVNVDNAARVDFRMAVGQVTSTAPLLQSDRADIATTYTAKQLVDLPRLDRNFQSFLLPSPGASRLGWNHASSENPQGSIRIQVNGQHLGSTGYQLDGTGNQDPILGIIVINPAIDSLTETKMPSHNYDAEFSYVGAGIVNASTKSGTNDLHGSMFEYLRANTPGFTTFARNPFGREDAADGGVPPVKWNQFGGSIGGAVIKNKLFVFGDTQVDFHRTFAARHRAPHAAATPMHVLVDRGSVELFADGGKAVISDRIFPAAGSDRLEVFAALGSRVKRLRVATIQ